jgi:hypothetical protein
MGIVKNDSTLYDFVGSLRGRSPDFEVADENGFRFCQAEARSLPALWNQFGGRIASICHPVAV